SWRAASRCRSTTSRSRAKRCAPGAPRVREWSAEQIAEAAGARLAAPVPSQSRGAGPARAVVDSRQAGPGDLFVGLPGANVDGGRFAPQALAQGAWGVLVAPEHAAAAQCAAPGVLL